MFHDFIYYLTCILWSFSYFANICPCKAMANQTFLSNKSSPELVFGRPDQRLRDCLGLSSQDISVCQSVCGVLAMKLRRIHDHNRCNAGNSLRRCPSNFEGMTLFFILTNQFDDLVDYDRQCHWIYDHDVSYIPCFRIERN